MHPDPLYSLSQSRIADLRADRRACPRPVHSPRRRLGWLLIDLGVRLATPPPRTTHPTWHRA